MEIFTFLTMFLRFLSLHWYLAIIYQPEYTLRPPQPTSPPATRKRKRDEELSVDSAIEASESRETPTTASKPTSKATTEVLGVEEIEITPESRPSSPRMEIEEQTQTNETTKPEEQEVESQLCADVSSVSLDEREQEGSDHRNGVRDDPMCMPCAVEEAMEIDDSPLSSPMHVDRVVHIEDLTGEFTPHGTTQPSVVDPEDTAPDVPTVGMEGSVDSRSFYGTGGALPKTYGSRKPRISASVKLESCSNGGDPDGDHEIALPKT